METVSGLRRWEFLGWLLDSSSPNQLHDHYDESNYQQYVDQVADGSTADAEAKSPKY